MGKAEEKSTVRTKYSHDICGNSINIPNSQIIVGFLNVCGLKRRPLLPDFTELVCESYLFMVTETKLDPTDLVNMDGYDFISKPQLSQRPCKRRSSGFGLFVKKNLSRCDGMWHSESEYVVWVKLDKRYTQSEHIFRTTCSVTFAERR